MTKADIINEIKELADDDIAHVNSECSRYGCIEYVDKAIDEYQRHINLSISCFQRNYDYYLDKYTKAMNTINTANAHLAKKESKTWREKLDKATEKAKNLKYNLDNANNSLQREKTA